MVKARIQEYSKYIELPVQRKLLSLLEGRHGGLGAGSSHEFLDMAEYRAGDDVKDIDWKSTARIGQTVIKRFESTALLNVLLAVDTGANMAALAPGKDDEGALGGGLEPKEDIAAIIVAAMAWLTAYRGDHLGLVAGDSSGIVTMPARSGLTHAQTMERVATRSTPTGAPGDYNAVLRRVDAVRRHRSVVVGITDFAQAENIDPAYLKRLGMRHKVFLFLVEDLDPTVLRGDQTLVDVRSGPLPSFVTGNDPHGAIEAQWRMDRKIRRGQVEQKLKNYGISWVSVRSIEDVPDKLIYAFGGGKRGSSSS